MLGVKCHFQVVGAKVVTSAKSPGAQCFGFVTMGSAEEALKCIENLHKTVLHEKTIAVEKVRSVLQEYSQSLLYTCDP